MSTLPAFLCALAVSLAAIWYLVQIDEKRRRVFRLRGKIPLPRSRPAGWMLTLLPATILLWLGELSAFLTWGGALMVMAWLIVSRVPSQAGDQDAVVRDA
jgi:hypothetical protein